MPPKTMDIKKVGNTYELQREQWRGHVAKISADDDLLDEVKKYTWTYSEGTHPYLRNSTIGASLHEFVLFHKYGKEHVKQMQAAGNIIEHLDNDGLNCTYENLHILSDDLNKAKAFTIDKMSKEETEGIPAFVLDVYYSHEEGFFQLQIFFNDDMYFNKETQKAVEMFLCKYQKFDDLYINWFYLLNSRSDRAFEISKFHASQIYAKERPYIRVTPEEANSPMIMRDGVWYLNLDAKVDGKSMTFLNHTSMRKIDDPNSN